MPSNLHRRSFHTSAPKEHASIPGLLGSFFYSLGLPQFPVPRPKSNGQIHQYRQTLPPYQHYTLPFTSHQIKNHSLSHKCLTTASRKPQPHPTPPRHNTALNHSSTLKTASQTSLSTKMSDSCTKMSDSFGRVALQTC